MKMRFTGFLSLQLGLFFCYASGSNTGPKADEIEQDIYRILKYVVTESPVSEIKGVYLYSDRAEGAELLHSAAGLEKSYSNIESAWAFLRHYRNAITNAGVIPERGIFFLGIGDGWNENEAKFSDRVFAILEFPVQGGRDYYWLKKSVKFSFVYNQLNDRYEVDVLGISVNGFDLDSYEFEHDWYTGLTLPVLLGFPDKPLFGK